MNDFSNIFIFGISFLFLYAGLWNCWLFKDSLSSWPPGKGKECNIVFKITSLDPNFHECEWRFCPCFWNIKLSLLLKHKKWFLYPHAIQILFFLTQKENQNHSYSLKSSASFNVIEFPYKNLSFEDIHNSTVVSNLHPAWVTTHNYLKSNTKWLLSSFSVAWYNCNFIKYMIHVLVSVLHIQLRVNQKFFALKLELTIFLALKT